MKKLTAGIFATLLTVVGVGAANAEIASKAYVDTQNTTQNTTIAGKADKATTLAGYGITDAATKTELTTGLEAKANTADLGALAELDAVGTAQITDKNVTKAKLADDIVTSLGKADSALQSADLDAYQTKTAADAAYAVKSTEGVANTASTNASAALTNIGTLSTLTTTAKGNTVAAINEVNATAKGTAATVATYGDVVTHDAADFATAAQGAKADTALQAADLDDYAKSADVATTYETNANAPATYATKTAIADMETKTNAAATYATKTALSDGLDGKQDTLTTAQLAAADSGITAAKVTTYDGYAATIASNTAAAATAQTAADNAQDAADAAQATADTANTTAGKAIPKPQTACSAVDAKCVLTTNGTTFEWEVVQR